MSKKYIPAEGRSVPLEDGSPWPVDEKGKPIPSAVPDTAFWRRRIADDDIVAPEPVSKQKPE